MTIQPAGSSKRPRKRVSRETPLGRLELVLSDAGVDQDRFAWAAAAAVAELQRLSGATVDEPVTQVSEADRRFLEAGGLDLGQRRSRDPQPLVDSAGQYAALLADSEDVAAVAERLGVTRARIRQRALERSLLAIRDGDEWRFPRAQFEGPSSRKAGNGGPGTARAPIRGLAAVSMALPPDLHPVDGWRFLTEPNGDLELGGRAASPLDWLRSGGSPDPVVAIAREL